MSWARDAIAALGFVVFVCAAEFLSGYGAYYLHSWFHQ